MNQIENESFLLVRVWTCTTHVHHCGWMDGTQTPDPFKIAQVITNFPWLHETICCLFSIHTGQTNYTVMAEHSLTTDRLTFHVWTQPLQWTTHTHTFTPQCMPTPLTTSHLLLLLFTPCPFKDIGQDSEKQCWCTLAGLSWHRTYVLYAICRSVPHLHPHTYCTPYAAPSLTCTHTHVTYCTPYDILYALWHTARHMPLCPSPAPTHTHMSSPHG